MADVPDGVNKGRIIATLNSFLADSADEGDIPDMIGLSGTVTLTPSVKTFRLTDSTPPMTAVAKTLICPVIGGELYPPGTGSTVGVDPGVWVISTEQPEASPSTFYWTASFQLTGIIPAIQPVTFSLPSEETVDLTNVIPSTPDAGTVQTLATPALFWQKWRGTQSEYDAIATKSPSVLYVIED